jgi:hypothetical protein
MLPLFSPSLFVTARAGGGFPLFFPFPALVVALPVPGLGLPERVFGLPVP